MSTEPKHRVCIIWQDSAYDWPYFYLLGSLGELVHLQGADFPDGSVKHLGDCFWVHHSEIKQMDDV